MSVMMYWLGNCLPKVHKILSSQRGPTNRIKGIILFDILRGVSLLTPQLNMSHSVYRGIKSLKIFH